MLATRRALRAEKSPPPATALKLVAKVFELNSWKLMKTAKQDAQLQSEFGKYYEKQGKKDLAVQAYAKAQRVYFDLFELTEDKTYLKKAIEIRRVALKLEEKKCAKMRGTGIRTTPIEYIGPEEFRKKAAKYIKRSEGSRLPGCCMFAGWSYLSAGDLEKNPESKRADYTKAVEWFERSARRETNPDERLGDYSFAETARKRMAKLDECAIAAQ